MKSNVGCLVCLILGLLLVACGGTAPVPTTPTDRPSETSSAIGSSAEAESPDAAPVAIAGGPLRADQALGATWQWTTLRPPDSLTPDMVPFPQNYALAFLPDGTVNIKADCNMVGGSYSLDYSGSLKMVLGPSTMAFCGEGSADIQFLNLLSKVVRGSFSAGELTLATSDGETLGFVDSATVAGAAAALEPDALQNTVWQWTGLSATNGEVASQTAVPNPESYTIIFRTDGKAEIVADCNAILGTYDLDDSSIKFVLDAAMSTSCSEDSWNQRFLALLGTTQTAVLDANGLTLTANNGTALTFVKGG